MPYGEVVVLDSAGYGTFTIAQPVSITAPAGVYAGISVFSGGIGVNISSGWVVLENLVINGLGGAHGIYVSGPAKVRVSNCTIANFSMSGVTALESDTSLDIHDTVIRGSNIGVLLQPLVSATLDRVQIVGNSVAGLTTTTSDFWPRGPGVTVKRSVVSANGYGMYLSGLSTVEDSLVSDNAGVGVQASASSTSGITNTVQLVRNTLTRNGDGASAGGLVVLHAKNNLITQNTQDGLVASGAGTTVIADRNTFSRNGGYALRNTGATVYTAEGADGLPNNAGEQMVPTSGTITPLSAF
jgi:hypothetical protein